MPDVDFERTFQRLKSEREGLSADWGALKIRRVLPSVPIEVEQKQFEGELRRALKRLQETRAKAAAVLPPPVEPKPAVVAPKKVEAVKPPEKSLPALPEPPRFERIDPLAQAHALMRNKQYQDALNAFDQVDLKLRKSDERAPILYLKACCFLNLGKTKDAIDLLQEVANYRGEEKLAGYAQWQLDALRWRREVDQRLQDFRQRQQTVEKR